MPWLPFGPDGGDARRLVAEPGKPAHLYLGTTSGWIFESQDGGGTWHRLARPGKRDDLVLDSIVVDAKNPKHLVVGAWVIDRPDGGLYTSTDGGATWSSQVEMRGQSIRSLTASLSDPKILVAGTLAGVFRTTDGAQHWQQISPADSREIHEVESVAIDPQNPDVVYAGTWHLPWKTSDAGAHWENIKNGIIDDSDVFSIIVDPVAPQTVYASACSGIYKSSDAGAQFQKVQGIPSTARRTRVLLQDPQHLDTVFAGTTEGLFRSDDAGKTWMRKTGPELIVNDVLVDAANSHRVLLATDRAGILASDDGGDTFKASNSGFSARQITALKRDANHPATLFAGIVNDKEWGGVFQSDNGGVDWLQRSTGLQGRDVFSLGQANDGTIIAGTSHGIFRLDTEADIWNKASGPFGAVSESAAVQTVSTIARPPVQIQRNRFTEAKQKSRKTTHKTMKSQQRGTKAKAGRRKASFVRTTKALHRKSQVTPHKSKHVSKHLSVARDQVRPVPGERAAQPKVEVATVPGPSSFDGAVYALATTEHVLLAATSSGLLSSNDNGLTWAAHSQGTTEEWRYLAADKTNVIAASLRKAAASFDAGANWSPISLPGALTQIAAVAIEPSGEIWIGGREGVFVSSDAGRTWSTPKNLFVNSVNSIFYDAASARVMVTTGNYSDLVFIVQLPSMQVTFADTGWNLRFVRPIGDHLVAATLFDGVVVQPKMVASPVTSLDPAGLNPSMPPPRD